MNLIDLFVFRAPRSVTVVDYDAPVSGLLVGKIGSG
jgi:hypothetical protein